MSFVLLLKSSSAAPVDPAELDSIRARATVAWSDGNRILLVRPDAATSLFDYSDRLVVTDGEHTEDLANEIASISWRDSSKLARIVRGNTIVLSKESNETIVMSDTLGSFPLFHGESSNGRWIAYATIFRDLAQGLGCETDFTGVYQYLAGGYSVGKRTFGKTIGRFLPGERHLIALGNDSPRISHGFADNPWATRLAGSWDETRLENTVAVLEKECARLYNCQLMFSAGWDSRTILAGLMAAGTAQSIVAYSHGDLGSREVRIASQISRDHGLARDTREIADLQITAETFERSLESCGHALFPHWRASAEHAQAQGRNSISAGIYGGVLGGHYSVPSVANGAAAQFRSLVKYLYLSKGPSITGQVAVDAAHARLFRGSFIPWWCLKDTVQEEMRSFVVGDTSADIRAELERLLGVGVETLEGLVEAFQVGQRGRQYMNAQLGICRSVLPIINPFSNADLVTTACGLPLPEKIHNQINRRILRHMSPSLLRYPMAATLVPAGWPVGLQEVSRGVRKALESARWKLYKFRKTEAGYRPNMGWVNFEYLRKQTLFHELIDSLEADFWDKVNMRKVVSNYPRGSIHPLYDMFCKIKSIDFAVQSDNVAL